MITVVKISERSRWWTGHKARRNDNYRGEPQAANSSECSTASGRTATRAPPTLDLSPAARSVTCRSRPGNRRLNTWVHTARRGRWRRDRRSALIVRNKLYWDTHILWIVFRQRHRQPFKVDTARLKPRPRPDRPSRARAGGRGRSRAGAVDAVSRSSRRLHKASSAGFFMRRAPCADGRRAALSAVSAATPSESRVRWPILLTHLYDLSVRFHCPRFYGVPELLVM
ncbi:hypothetical protein EVAR_47195_1 [Eumeta japonica]|uniref:Uncharacterized protein n=1 Tax=Eumeta variegata TaxID=151549 RepID=A0A4C1WVN5_EUMVA|nr:hypothetical protein EVAR_47195_1 [Eumeta japonica]